MKRKKPKSIKRRVKSPENEPVISISDGTSEVYFTKSRLKKLLVNLRKIL